MAQAPRRSVKKTSRPTPKTKVVKASAKKEAPPPKKDLKNLLPKLRMGTTVRVIVLLVIVIGIFVFNPQSGIINQNSGDNSNSLKSYKIDIRNRTLADPHQGDLKLKVGTHSILEVTTDEDGRIDLVSGNRDVFNPIFSNIGNTLSVPTDRAESFRIEFHPASSTGNETTPVVIGTVIVQD